MNRKREFAAAAFLLAMTACHCFLIVSLLPSLQRGYQDFTIFYSAGRLLRSGQAANLYSLPDQYRAQREFAPEVPIRQAALPYNHPPFEALLFVPFTFMNYVPAYALWTVLNLIMLASSLMLLSREFVELQALPLAFLGIAASGFFPVALGILQGQDDVLLLLIITIGLVLLHRNWDVAAGGVMALGLTKPQLIIPLALLLGVRRWRVLAGFIPVSIALALISVAVVGFAGAINYVEFVLFLEKSGAGGAVDFAFMPNLRGLIGWLAAVGHTQGYANVLTLICSVTLLLIAVWKIRKGPDSVVYAFGLATVTAILVSYHALTYDLSLLLPAILFLLCKTVTNRNKAEASTIVLMLLLFLTPLYALLLFRINRMCWFAIVLLWFFVKLARDQDVAEVSV